MPKYLVQIDTPRVEEATVALQALRPFTVTRRVFDYLVVETPLSLPQFSAQALRLAGVVSVHPDTRMSILAQPPVNEMVRRYAAGIANPFTLGPTLLRSLATQPAWPTSESRQVVGADVADADGITGRGVKVAVLDTGIDPFGPQSPGATGESYVSGDPLFVDNNGHGTHCATTVAGIRAATPFGRGICVGVAPGAELIHIKVLGYLLGIGDFSEIMTGMERARDLGVKIISLSLGGPDTDDPKSPEHRVVKLLADSGIMVVIAAGNSGPDAQTIGSPGSAPAALTVGAINRGGELAGFSSRGPTLLEGMKPDCVAPGVDILSATAGMIDAMEAGEGPKWGSISGTSMATPHVAGVLALAEEYARTKGKKGKTWTTERIKDALGRYGEPKNHQQGWGLITYPLLKRYIDDEQVGERGRPSFAGR